ncbi:MAG: response regulator transcription factor [Cetobacterium sp.]|uniref:response regulator transcription factor n=1 Tax=unclassified Cetobacterium TaxID=2630983 RepID=UPI00163D0800|nr:response regulator transcription factor [Cetobacterium sp. 2A]MBC2856867.1 response regulator transcription factor [Cetobacterium sp. 2A]
MEKILLIEDDKKIRRYLELELTHTGYKIDFAENGEIGLEKTKINKYDLILLDLMLPKLSGEEVCKEIRQITDTPIIILSAKNEMLSKVYLLDLGADDYITKPFVIEELLARIRVALRHMNKKNNSKILEYEDLKVDNEIKSIYLNDEILILTKTEFNLLNYLILNREIVLSREQILNSVWGIDYFGDEKIVDVYIKNIRKKIGENYIKTIRGFGYCLRKDRR